MRGVRREGVSVAGTVLVLALVLILEIILVILLVLIFGVTRNQGCYGVETGTE